MPQSGEVLSSTESVCPTCLARVCALRVREAEHVYLYKVCPEHGEFRTILWRGFDLYQEWSQKRLIPSQPPACSGGVDRGCPFDCGLCTEHRQHTCCVVLEVTERCNLKCPICFSSANSAPQPDPTPDEIELWCRALLERGGPYNIQLSGGEPTVRDDLPQLIRSIRRLGFPFQQLNTNGLRLAHEKDYPARLKDAGLGCVFLQFDGVNDAVYRHTRGRDLLDIKLQAIRNCAEAELGVVLVPTLVPGVNTHEIGDILGFALEHAPAVRAVHFQPISYFGRYPQPPRDCDRITLPEVMQAIETQTGGRFRVRDFYPAAGENAFCEFHGKFWLRPTGKIEPAPRPTVACCAPPVEAGLVQLGSQKRSGDGDGARAARKFVAQHWSFPAQPAPVADPLLDLSSFDEFLARKGESFCISGMAFQDAWNLDLERLRECFLHVLSPAQKLIPLCAYNLSAANGRTLYRSVGEQAPYGGRKHDDG
ncbi:MAG TPA: radical SAM protein [Candidatus Acidoferrales bacterium]|nr:radical SAM protein [Candidatus Acidoferrales bacterium]